jgi:hypothetical protein
MRSMDAQTSRLRVGLESWLSGVVVVSASAIALAGCAGGAATTTLPPPPELRDLWHFPSPAIGRFSELGGDFAVAGDRVAVLEGAENDGLTDKGVTTTEDLGPLCRHDHIGKDGRGRRVELIALGTLEWTSPLGHKYVVNGPAEQRSPPRR